MKSQPGCTLFVVGDIGHTIRDFVLASHSVSVRPSYLAEAVDFPVVQAAR